MIFEFTKNHHIKIEIDDEPTLILNKGAKPYFKYYIREFYIDGNLIPKKENYDKYFMTEFDYFFDGNNEVFCLELRYDILNEFRKYYPEIDKTSDSVKLRLPKSIEDTFVNQLIPKGKKALDETLKEIDDKIREKDKLINDDTMISLERHSTYGYFLSCEVSSNSFLLKGIQDKMNSFKDILPKSELAKYKTFVDWEDYSTTTYYKLTYLELKNIMIKLDEIIKEHNLEKQKKAKERENKLNNIKKIARETNQPQFWNRWIEPCNEPNEECNLDILTKYVMPDGTFKVTRSHTY